VWTKLKTYNFKEMDNIFIVYAENGSQNGWAAVEAESKNDAQEAAYNTGWLGGASVTGIESWDEHIACSYIRFMTPEDLATLKRQILDGLEKEGFYELEWGS
jgi:hypothetical protein